MSQKAPWLVLSAVVLVAAAIFAVLAMGSPGGTPGNVAVPGEAQTPLQGETMVADPGGDDTAARGADNSIERQQMAEPPSGASGQLRVQGRLVFADGRPAEGQDVSMRRLREFRDLDGLALDDLQGIGNENRENREEVTSDEDGRFSYLVDAGVGGLVRLEEDDWIFPNGTVSFQVSTADVDLGDLEVIVAGLLAGVVLDPSGQPVEGVNVRAGRGPMLGLSRGGGRTSVVTDDSGRFQIGGLRPGEYYLRTASSAFLPEDHNVTLAAGERRDDLILSLEQGQAVAGQVVDDMGRPVADINVAARRRSSPSAGVTVQRFTPAEATVTDDNGLFLLAGLDGEDATVRAWGSGYADTTETGVAIGTSNLVLQVQRLAVIAGVLVDETGAAIAGSRVRASASRGGNGFAMEIFETGGRLTNASATTEEDGSFRLENVRPGTLTVRATGDSHRPAELPGVVLNAGDVVEGVRLMATRGASVAVEVLDSEGQPVANANVVVVEPPERPQAGARRGNFAISRDVSIEERGGERIIIDGTGERVLGRGRTDSEGMVVIGGLPSGAAQVKAEHTELIAAQPREVNLPLAGTVNAQLTMSPGGFADVTVLDVRGQPISGAQYMVSGPQGPDGSGEEHAGRTDGVGAARVGPLAPGMYSARLQLAAQGRRMGSGMFVSTGSSRTLDESRTEFNVRPGENTVVELTKPILTAFSGTIYDASGPVSGATVELQLKPEGSGARRGRGPRRMTVGGGSGGGGGGSFHGTSGPDGKFLVADLSPGTYTVEYGRPEQVVKAELEVQFVPGQAESQQDLRLRGGTVRITVMSQDRGGPLAGARVEVVRPSDEGEDERQVFMVAMTVDGGSGETMSMEMGANRVLTDADGVAVIDAVPPGNYSLRITHSTHVEHIVSDQLVGDGQVTDAGVAAMVLGGNVRGQVRRADGSDVMIAMVEYRPADGDDEDQLPAMRGSFNLEGLKPGKYLVRASDPMGGRSNWGPEEEVEVVAGQTASVSLRLPDRE